MAKSIFFFLVFWGIVTGGLHILRQQSAKENWTLTKNVAYGFFTSMIAFILIGLFVILF